MAYEYGTAIGLPASQVLDLPIAELHGFFAWRKIKAELNDG